MSFFAIPLSGLIASQEQLQAVSSNLANLDTVGYKDQNVNFADIFAQSGLQSGGVVNGANDPIQTGLGVSVAETTSNFSNGNITATNIPSNMALSGNGFFVTKQTDGTVGYTRAGDFTTNKAGYLVSPEGGLVLGYPATNGVVSTSSAPQPLQVGSGAVIPAAATSTFQMTTNLTANAANGDTFSSPVSIYDSLGNQHAMNVTYTKTAANTWSYSVNVPTADTGATSSVVASGTLNFSSSGVLASTTDSSGVTTTPAGSISGINIPSFKDGAAAMNLTWDLNNSAGSPLLSQTNIASETSATSQNGNASGSLSGYTVEADGTIQGSFTGGGTLALGQVAIASFTNTQGLQRSGSNLYDETAGSGPALIGTAGTGGRGTITGGSIESSNVNTASEFANMIVAQQAYQANAKTVTTFDQISQATIAMITA